MSAAPPVYKRASMLKVVLIAADENDHQRREDGRAGREADGKKEQAESDEPVLVSLRERPPRPLLSFRVGYAARPRHGTPGNNRRDSPESEQSANVAVISLGAQPRNQRGAAAATASHAARRSI